MGSRDLFIDEAHTALDIFPACCLVRFAVFFLKNFQSVTFPPFPSLFVEAFAIFFFSFLNPSLKLIWFLLSRLYGIFNNHYVLKQLPSLDDYKIFQIPLVTGSIWQLQETNYPDTSLFMLNSNPRGEVIKSFVVFILLTTLGSIHILHNHIKGWGSRLTY